MAWEPIIIIEPEHLGLHQTVMEQLLAQHKTIATAESCTGGSLAAWITTLPGASQVFECGVVTYANRIKTKLLGVKPQTLEQQGAVSYDTCAQMALGLEKLSGRSATWLLPALRARTGALRKNRWARCTSAWPVRERCGWSNTSSPPPGRTGNRSRPWPASTPCTW